MWEDDDDLDLSNLEYFCSGETASSSDKNRKTISTDLTAESCVTANTGVLLESGKKLKLNNNDDNFVASFQANQLRKTLLFPPSSEKPNEENTNFTNCEPANCANIRTKSFNNQSPFSGVHSKKCANQHVKVPSFLCSRDDSDLDLDLSQWEAPIKSRPIDSTVKRKTLCATLNVLTKPAVTREEGFCSPSASISVGVSRINANRTIRSEQLSCSRVNNRDSSKTVLNFTPNVLPDNEFSLAVNNCYAASTDVPARVSQPLGSLVASPVSSSSTYSGLLASTPAFRHSRPIEHFSTNTFSETINKTAATFLTPVRTKASRLSGSSGRKRRFPGPAGLLPQLCTDESLKLLEFNVQEKSTSASTNAVAQLNSGEIPCSQSSEEDFVRSAWLTMEEQLRLNPENQSNFLLKYSVAWLIRKESLSMEHCTFVSSVLLNASAKLLPCGKMPFLTVTIKSLSVKGVDAYAVFRDKTGEILGTIHRQLLEEYSNIMQVGSVLVLKQIGVFSPSNRRHYLNITRQNVLYIYSTEENGKVTTNKLFVGNWHDVAKETEHLSASTRVLDTNAVTTPQPNLNNTRPAIAKALSTPYYKDSLSATPRRASDGSAEKSCTIAFSQQKHTSERQPQQQLANVDYSKSNMPNKFGANEQSSSLKKRQSFTFKSSDCLRSRSQKADMQKNSQLNSTPANPLTNAAASKEVISWQEDDFDKLLEEMSEEDLMLGSGFVT